MKIVVFIVSVVALIICATLFFMTVAHSRSRTYTGMGFHAYRPLGHVTRHHRWRYDYYVGPVGNTSDVGITDVGEIRTGKQYDRDCDPTTIVDSLGVTRYVHDQTNCNR